MTSTPIWYGSRQAGREGQEWGEGRERREASETRFLSLSVLLFSVSAAITIVSCASMSRTGEMPMAGGWTMSMVWMRMPQQTWVGAAASFLCMWIAMMVAMMLPSLVPTLRRYRHTVGTAGEMHIDRLTALVGAGYFCIWIVVGLMAFALGVAVTSFGMARPAVGHAAPIAAGVTIVIAGLWQFTALKARCLGCCRDTHERRRPLTNDAAAAWREGMRLGLDCATCCANLMAILLVIGIMDLRAMAVITTAITAERLAPNLRLQTSRRSRHAGELVAHAIGAVVVAAGVLWLARATTLI